MTTSLAPSHGRRILRARPPVAIPPVVAIEPGTAELEQGALPAQCAANRFDDVALTISSMDSAALLRGHKTVRIAHNGFVYTLQATKLGKLILTK